MIDSDQARRYIDAMLGVAPPDFALDAAVEQVGEAEQAMIEAGYSDAKQTLVQCMAVAIVASAGAPRRIASQGAPSGASRSFFNDPKALTALRRELAALDDAGTVAGLIGPDPAGSAMFMVVC